MNIYDRVRLVEDVTMGSGHTISEGTEGEVVQLFAGFGGGPRGVHTVGVVWDGKEHLGALKFGKEHIKEIVG